MFFGVGILLAYKCMYGSPLLFALTLIPLTMSDYVPLEAWQDNLHEKVEWEFDPFQGCNVLVYTQLVGDGTVPLFLRLFVSL